MRRCPRIREGLLKVLEELDYFVPASQHPSLGPGRCQSILELIGEYRVGGLDVARVPGSIPLLEALSERSKELGLSSRHRPRSISLEAGHVLAIVIDGRLRVGEHPVGARAAADQCRHGSWKHYGFKNQGRCIRFVKNQARQGCRAERAEIGRPAFREKYGNPKHHHWRPFRRCVRQTVEA